MDQVSKLLWTTIAKFPSSRGSFLSLFPPLHTIMYALKCMALFYFGTIAVVLC